MRELQKTKDEEDGIFEDLGGDARATREVFLVVMTCRRSLLTEQRSGPNAFGHRTQFPEPRTGLRSGSGQVAELGTGLSVRFSRGSVRTEL